MKTFLKILKIIGITLVTIFVLIATLNIIPFTFSKVKGTNEFRKSGDSPIVVPHGGAKLLAPENTIYSYEMLSDMGIFFFEIDLALTKDDQLISHHDLFLGMSDDSSYNETLVRELDYAEILSAYEDDDYYNARSFVDQNNQTPFLNSPSEELTKMVPARLEEDIFEVYKEVDMLYILEIKDNSKSSGFDADIHNFETATDELIRLINLYELKERVVIGSFDDEVINYIKSVDKDIKVGAATSEATMFAVLSALHLDFFWGVKSEVLILPNPQSMKIPSSLVGVLKLLPQGIRNNIAVDIDGVLRANLMGKQIIKDAHRKNIAVYYWTINDPEQMRLLIENGADGIITDRPDLLIDIIDEMADIS